ncbi:MAG: hypothetical protein H6624_01055 [Bdellovibrionaceae bacterium]|nr:hypothetical protein [Bdellovibrionales bacterium]MCB9082897.1 hypothetical protein [Pseudobdellovibrionaceae bacterium]
MIPNLKPALVALIFCHLIAATLMGCTIWQSEGREFLEKQGLEFAASKLQKFLDYKDKACSPDASTHPEHLLATGAFVINSESGIWLLDTFSQEEGLGFSQHFVQIRPNEGDSVFYCYPIQVDPPTDHLSSTHIDEFFAE